MSHLPDWEREGLTYQEYAERTKRRLDRTYALALDGLTPLEAAKRAIEEVQE